VSPGTRLCSELPSAFRGTPRPAGKQPPEPAGLFSYGKEKQKMPAVLNINCYYFFFDSTINAAKVADLLNRATLVDHDYRANSYRLPDKDDRPISIDIKMTSQKKPAPAKLALPEKVPSNNEFHQIKR
jgi:hypothetical protein